MYLNNLACTDLKCKVKIYIDLLQKKRAEPVCFHMNYSGSLSLFRVIIRALTLGTDTLA